MAYRAIDRMSGTAPDRPDEHLGRKGTSTRRRLMDSARKLLEHESPVGITSSAIAHGAGASPATFYNYFTDVEAIIHALCEEVTADAESIIASIQPVSPGEDAHAIAERFVDAYDEYWLRHRAILCIRNMEADRGNSAFRFMRRKFALTMMDGLMETAKAVRSTPLPESTERLGARIAVIVAAVERLAAVNGLYEVSSDYPTTPRELLREAQVNILAAILNPGIVFESVKRRISDVDVGPPRGNLQ